MADSTYATVSRTSPTDHAPHSTPTTSPLRSLNASRLTISVTDQALPIPSAPEATTKTHTDHVLTATWTATHGWSAPRIAPYANLSLPPTASVLHYATACFEGMKLYRGYDDKLRLFRPLENCRRLLASAMRISLPVFEPEELLKLIKELCRVDGQRWLPSETGKGSCLYLRPTMIGMDADLGFHVPQEVLLYVIITHWPSAAIPASNVNGKEKSTGIKLWANNEESVRAWPGGSGSAKVAANYGPALRAHAEARKKGLDQVLWLFGPERKVTEAGSTNFFVIWRTPAGRLELITPPLENGLILPGITRRSVLELAKERFKDTTEWKLGGRTVVAAQVDVVERDFTMADVVDASHNNSLLAAFAVSTAFFVKPVSQISFQNSTIHIGANALPHPALLREWLSNIMYGVEESAWVEAV